MSQVADLFKGSSPDFKSPMPNFNSSGPDNGSDISTIAATQNESEEGKVEPGCSTLRELVKDFEKTEQTLTEMLTNLSTSPTKLSAKRNTSPPLINSLAQRASSLSYEKPKASPLRHEIRRSSAQGVK